MFRDDLTSTRNKMQFALSISLVHLKSYQFPIRDSINYTIKISTETICLGVFQKHTST